MHRRVLVLRPDNLGDLVLFSGAFRYLRSLFPEAEITVCVKRYGISLLEFCPYVDRVLVWEDLLRPLPGSLQFRGKSRLEHLLLRVRCMLAPSYDLILVPVRSPTPTIHEVASAFRSAKRIGITGDRSNLPPVGQCSSEAVYDSRLHLSPDRKLSHEFEVNRDFLRFLSVSVNVQSVWPEFWTDEQDRGWAAQHVTGGSDEVILGIAPGVSSLPAKQYPVDRLAAAVSGLTGLKVRVVLFGGATEATQCSEVAGLLSLVEHVTSVVNLAGKSSVRQLVEGLRCCDVVLSEETAALHIATALRKPTVGIVGGGHFGRFYPWGDPEINRVVNQPMECYGCNWQCRYDTMRCIQDIAPECITRELQHLLSEASRGRNCQMAEPTGQSMSLCDLQ